MKREIKEIEIEKRKANNQPKAFFVGSYRNVIYGPLADVPEVGTRKICVRDASGEFIGIIGISVFHK